ncbi:hypothetical protein At12D13_45310 (plasmid) [Agrobacterium fabrum]|nr:hypothetical protein At12D13_45310 [Agrobacterium fabrum]
MIDDLLTSPAEWRCGNLRSDTTSFPPAAQRRQKIFPLLPLRAIDRAIVNPNADTVAEAQIVTAEAKILSTEIAIAATNKLFELEGTRSTLAEHNLDRHWRNARTHTLHDPVRWKYAILGKYFLNREKPPLHARVDCPKRSPTFARGRLYERHGRQFKS